MKKYFLLSACALCVLVSAGCSKSTGVMPWSDNRYSVSADVDKTVFTKPSDAEQLAYKDASRFCSEQGQGVHVESFQHVNSWWHYTVKLIFRCIPSNEERRGEEHDIRKVDVEML